MGNDTGFLEHSKQDVPRRPIAERIKDFREYDVHYSESEIRVQASRCMDCGIPFCHNGCPLGNQIPDWNDLVYRGHWRKLWILFTVPIIFQNLLVVSAQLRVRNLVF